MINNTERYRFVMECATSPKELDPRIARSRAKVMAAATELLVESGPRAVTVDAVAERSGVAKSTMYRHWESRRALMIDVLRSNQPAVPPIDTALGFEAALRHHLDGFADSIGDPEWQRIMPALFQLKMQLPEVDQMTEEDRHERELLLAELLRRGAQDGVVPEGLDPFCVAMTLFGPLVMAVMVGHPERARELGQYAIDRFIASYAQSSVDV